MSVQEGIHDVRRLQRWRTNVQRKHNRSTSEDETDLSVNKTFLSTVAEIFFFIGSDPDKAVSRNIAICSWVRGYCELVTPAGLAHSVERLTAEREVAGSIPSESLSTFATSQTKRGWLEKRNCSGQSLEMQAFKWTHQNSSDWLNTVTWNTVNTQISARCACPIIWVEREKREGAYFKGEVGGGGALFFFFRILASR